MLMLPCAFCPLAEHAEFGQNCFDASIGSVHVCMCYSMPMDVCFFNHSFPFHQIVGFYLVVSISILWGEESSSRSRIDHVQYASTEEKPANDKPRGGDRIRQTCSCYPAR